MSDPSPSFRLGGNSFELHDAKLGVIHADGTVTDLVPLASPTTLHWRSPDEPAQQFSFSRDDFSANASFTWTYPTLTHRQFRQITALLFGRKRHSNKIEHAIKRRQLRRLAKLRKNYPGIGEAFDHIVEDLNYIGEVKIPSDDAADV